MLVNPPLILIPARMSSTRLANKPLADIEGLPMIIRVAQQAEKAKCGDILIATDHEAIARVAKKYGFDSFITTKKHFSGSDRIYEALCSVDPCKFYQNIINLQGDLPAIDPDHLRVLSSFLQNSSAEIVTLGAPIHKEDEKNNPNIVKIIASPKADNHFQALYFTRAPAPYGEGPLYHHIGIYGYKRAALEKFVTLAPSYLEEREKLEQLRALEHNMRIDVTMVKEAPISVDTPEDLTNIRHYLRG